MLQQIRDKAQSWIAIAIVGLLVLGLSTVAWDAYFSPDPEVPVAKVNGEKITSNEFQRAYSQQRARLQQMLGGADISQFIPDELEFKKSILKRLEEEELIFQAAVAAGYRVSDALLAQQIRNFEVFQADSQFDSALYEQWLRSNYMSAGEFEEMLRRDVLLQQYRLAVGATSWSTDQERDALLRLQEQKRDVGFVTIAVANYLDKVNVSDEEAQAYYDNNASRFATQEKVSIEYLELNIADISKDVDVDEAKLQEIYQERKSDFGAPEERRTRHIMIEVAGDATAEQLKSARDKAEALLKQIAEEGATFETLARENSDDIGTANDGGDLGYLSYDSMIDPVYADTAFALKKDEVSDVVKSAYGFHIIKLEGINAGQVKAFAEIKTELEQEYRRHQAEDRFFEQGEILANMTFENPDTLSVAAQELGLSVATSDLFSRDGGAGVANNDRIRAAAFAEEVLLQGLNSQPLELAGDRVMVLRIKDHQQSSIRPFDDVKVEIVKVLRQQAAEAMAEKEGKAVLELLTDNNTLESIATERKLKWNHPEAIKRNSTTVAADISQKAFRLDRPETAKAVHAGLRMSSGDYVVIALFSVLDADIKSVESGAAQSIKDQRARYYGASELSGAMTDMRQSAEIKEYPENL